MDIRDDQARLRRLHRIAFEHGLECEASRARIGALIQPFIDRYKNLRLARQPLPAQKSKLSAIPLPVRHEAHEIFVRQVRAAGLDLRRRGIRGLALHTALQRAVAELAPTFGYRGFTECAATYDPPEKTAPPERPGRMDVVWAHQRNPIVLFEIDRTVKHISFLKLQLAQAPHKYWIYFGQDVWDFKTSLRRWDATGEIAAIIVPVAFTPTASNLTP